MLLLFFSPNSSARKNCTLAAALSVTGPSLVGKSLDMISSGFEVRSAAPLLILQQQMAAVGDDGQEAEG